MPSNSYHILPFLAAATIASVFALPDSRASDRVADEIRKDALNSDAGYDLLARLCDTHGGRIPGMPNSSAALRDLAAEIEALGLDPHFEYFTMPSWKRGDDTVELLEPVARSVRAVALSYTTPQPPFEAVVIDLGKGSKEDFQKVTQAGAVGLIDFKAAVPTAELHQLAEEVDLRGMLQINRVGGGQLLARSGNMKGDPLPFPVFSITKEEGLWMRRLLNDGKTVRVRVEVNSRPFPADVANLSVRFPGRSGAKVVLGGHFDSWDLGQGAMDNGLGIAQLFETARLLSRHSPENHHAIEIVWFEGEEMGLWGSRERARLDADSQIVAMMNLDMVGWPKSANAMGHDELIPVLESFKASLPDNFLPEGVVNIAWMTSDHTPYSLSGVRTITLGAPIPPESVRYYHDLADTLDKVDPAMLREANAVIASLIVTLANDHSLPHNRLTTDEIRKILRKAKLEKRMLQSGLWNPEE